MATVIKKKRTLSQQAQVAKIIRKALKERGIKASVTSESYSMGNSVRVEVTDLLKSEHEFLQRAFAKYQYGHFDGMNDIYEHSNTREDIPQTKFLFITNNLSEALKEEIYQEVRKTWYGGDELPETYEEGKNIYFDGHSVYISDLVYRLFRERG